MARQGGKIRGITIEIGGDTTKLQNSLKQVDSALSNTQGALKDINKLLKLNPGNTELLVQKQETRLKSIPVPTLPLSRFTISPVLKPCTYWML